MAVKVAAGTSGSCGTRTSGKLLTKGHLHFVVQFENGWYNLKEDQYKIVTFIQTSVLQSVQAQRSLDAFLQKNEF